MLPSFSGYYTLFWLCWRWRWPASLKCQYLTIYTVIIWKTFSVHCACVCLFINSLTLWTFKLQPCGLEIVLNVIRCQINQSVKLKLWILMKYGKYVELIRVNEKCHIWAVLKKGIWGIIIGTPKIKPRYLHFEWHHSTSHRVFHILALLVKNYSFVHRLLHTPFSYKAKLSWHSKIYIPSSK